MKCRSFSGGVHPSIAKELTQDIPIKVIPIPNELIIPLSQHTGAPCKPLVAKGDKVLKGQKIGESEAFISAPVHSPTSGEVVDVKPHIHPLGQKINSVFIKPDMKDEWVDNLPKVSNIDDVSTEEIVKKVKEAGIVGLGGAAFPTHVKLSPPKDKKIDTLLINAVECEPYLTADYRLMLEEKERILIGIKLLLKGLGINNAYLAIEDNKPKAIELMREALKKITDINLVILKTKYPQGSEKQLIEAITKRKVPVGKLPLDVGVVVQNVGTAKAVADAVLEGKPLIERVLTVTGSNIKNPGNFLVRIGSKFSDIIEFCGGPYEELSKVIMGGPMMGIAVSSLDVPVIKGTSGILLLSKKEVKYNEPGPCIKCGKCLQVCPMAFAPSRFVEAGEIRDYDQAMKDNISSCMECGSCSYVCPARRPMVQWIKVVKSQIQKKSKEKK
ncbi:MAG: electron transport complex subunit RsxC [bacterium]